MTKILVMARRELAGFFLSPMAYVVGALFMLTAALWFFYKIFIPFIIGGLCLQILLHLWRVLVNR